MTYTDIEDSVIAKLQALGETKKFGVYETDIPIGTNRPNEYHATLPYVLIDFGNKGQQQLTEQGITSTVDNLKWTSVVFEVVSNNPATSRRIGQIIRDNFEGYSPDPTWGEFVERVSAPMYVRQASEGGELHPARYYRSIAYVVDVDA